MLDQALGLLAQTRSLVAPAQTPKTSNEVESELTETRAHPYTPEYFLVFGITRVRFRLPGI